METRRGMCDCLLVQLLRVDLELLVGDPENDVPGNQAREAGHEAFVKRGWPFLHHHTNSAILDAFVLAGGAVHVTSLHHVDRAGGQRGAQPCRHGGRDVAGNPIAQVSVFQDEILDDVVANDLRHVHDRVSRDVGHSSLKKGEFVISFKRAFDRKRETFVLKFSKILESTLSC